MKYHLALLSLALAGAGCAGAGGAGTGSLGDDGYDGAFVTTLGDDTVAVERFRRAPRRVDADVVLRSPTTTLTRYRLDLDASGALARFEAVSTVPGASADALPLRREVAVADGDSLRVTVTEGGETQTRSLAAGAGALPFIDMVHWPFELVLSRTLASGRDSLVQPLFTDRATVDFRVAVDGAGALTLTHPFRGAMAVRAGARGELLSLDAGATTRKLRVARVADVDIDGLGRRFAALDAAGRPFGALSGRGETRATVDGATIVVDYGQPARRGREIFGALVPWGAVWRTGANRATHLTTDRDLLFGGLRVPAGEYTLYTIPAPDGGLLIFNSQTGQGGTTYDAARDLGRVPLTLANLAEPVELFTISVEGTGDGGIMQLLWDRTALGARFTVAP